MVRNTHRGGSAHILHHAGVCVSEHDVSNCLLSCSVELNTTCPHTGNTFQGALVLLTVCPSSLSPACGVVPFATCRRPPLRVRAPTHARSPTTRSRVSHCVGFFALRHVQPTPSRQCRCLPTSNRNHRSNANLHKTLAHRPTHHL